MDDKTSLIRQTSPSAALLDLDGTLIHNEHEYFYGHLVELYAKLGEQPPEKSLFDAQIRRNELFWDIAEERRNSFSRAFWKLFAAVDFPDPNPIQGVEDTLEILLMRGIHIAIITARTQLPQDVEAELNKAGLLRYINVISTLGENGFETSSGPELKKGQILHVCNKLNVSPEQCFVAGDSPSDIVSGRAAGVSFTVGLLSGGLEEEVLKLSGPDLLLPTICEMKNHL